MLLLSGDVHWAQLFQMTCKSYTGYNLHEVCSSGMTHIFADSLWRGIEDLMEGHTPRIFSASDINMKLNYATIKIEKAS